MEALCNPHILGTKLRKLILATSAVKSKLVLKVLTEEGLYQVPDKIVIFLAL